MGELEGSPLNKLVCPVGLDSNAISDKQPNPPAVALCPALLQELVPRNINLLFFVLVLAGFEPCLLDAQDVWVIAPQDKVDLAQRDPCHVDRANRDPVPFPSPPPSRLGAFLPFCPIGAAPPYFLSPLGGSSLPPRATPVPPVRGEGVFSPLGLGAHPPPSPTCPLVHPHSLMCPFRPCLPWGPGLPPPLQSYHLARSIHGWRHWCCPYPLAGKPSSWRSWAAAAAYVGPPVA